MTDFEKDVPETIEKLKEKKSLDLGVLIQNTVSYPKGETTIFLDGLKAQEALDLSVEIAEDEARIAEEIDENGTIAGPEGLAEQREDVREKTAHLQELLNDLEAGALTFHLRGLAPKLWRTIDKVWRNKMKADKDADDFARREIDMARNEKVNIDMVRNAITSIVDAEGNEYEGTPPFEQIEALYDNVLETEWYKLKELSDQLTFANELFGAASGDADFLRQSSLGEETSDTSSPSESPENGD